MRELRRKKGLTQLQLAEMLNVNETAVQHWESGRNQTDFETLVRIADFFDVTIDYLLGRTNR